MALPMLFVLAVLGSSSAQNEFRPQAEIVDLAFFVDVTGSMWRYIEGTRDAIRSIVDEFAEDSSPIRTLRVAFVGYRDCSDTPRFEILQFTQGVELFKAYVGGVPATGGGDIKEDVLGGLLKVLALNWSPAAGTKVLFHIADAPGHDQLCENRFSESNQNFSIIPFLRNEIWGHARTEGRTKKGSEDAYKVLRSLKANNITYNFGRIKALSTDSMIKEYSRILGEPIRQFNISSGGGGGVGTPCHGRRCCVPLPTKRPCRGRGCLVTEFPWTRITRTRRTVTMRPWTRVTRTRTLRPCKGRLCPIGPRPSLYKVRTPVSCPSGSEYRSSAAGSSSTSESIAEGAINAVLQAYLEAEARLG